VNAVNTLGYTPLDSADGVGRDDIVRILKAAGAVSSKKLLVDPKI